MHARRHEWRQSPENCAFDRAHVADDRACRERRADRPADDFVGANRDAENYQVRANDRSRDVAGDPIGEPSSETRAQTVGETSAATRLRARLLRRATRKRDEPIRPQPMTVND